MYSVLLVGAGQLGSRHLQGLMTSQYALHIIVVDTSIDSLRLAELRANEIGLGAHKIEYTNAIPPSDIDVCIIATSSAIRAKVTREVLNRCSIRNVIFEKVLFQKEDEYIEVDKLIKNARVKAWVNCPRRLYPSYQELKSRIRSDQLTMTVSGSAWGMACNSIHFIDLFAYLVGRLDYSIGEKSRIESVYESKRAGYYEANGRLEVLFGNSVLKISCCDGEGVSINNRIEDGQTCFEFKETSGEILVTGNGLSASEDYKMALQSQLTGECVDSILNKGECQLTTLADSIEIHMPFLKFMQMAMNQFLHGFDDRCPIT